MPERPLNIFIADPHLRGGGQVTYVTHLARELVRRGHQVSIGCREHSALVEAAAAAGATALPHFQFGGGVRLRSWQQDLRTMRRFLLEHKPDILHLNGSQDHWTGAAANRFAGSPACVVRTRHNTYPVKNSWANRKLNRHWTAYQIVVCDMVRQRLAQQATFEARRMCTIHNGVDAELFRPDLTIRRSAREEFGYGEDEVVIGIAARLVPAKGHEYLFKAVAQLRETFSEMRVLVLGQGALEEHLKQLAESLKIAPLVHFAGFRSDMAHAVQAFDIGAQPSIDCDTSSFSLKEQMALEIPVVASDYGGLKEIVSDGVEGNIVPSGTVQPLASVLRRFIADPALRRRMGGAGRKRVLREFTVEVFADRTLAAYEKALHYHREHTAH